LPGWSTISRTTVIRLRVADTCKDFGLVRFQKSVFFGEVTASTFERMGEALDRAAGPGRGGAGRD
jgi:CRISPR/Cas system-associated endoribonuclease Cas2